MLLTRGRDFDEVFMRLSRELITAPVANPRQLPTREVLGATLEIANSEFCILRHPERRLKRDYIRAEIDWYLSGTREIAAIAKHASAWESVADADGSSNSAYGWQVFTQPTPTGVSQFDHAVSTLVQDPQSRQAVINVHQVRHKYPTRDVPCTIAVQFILRDGLLHEFVFSRSTDFIWGLGNDVPFFVFLQHMVCSALRRQRVQADAGYYSQVCSSLHVYERHFKMLERVCEADSIYQSSSLFSVLSTRASHAVFSGEPPRPSKTKLSAEGLGSGQPSWRDRAREKISRIREKEDPNIYPLF